jgi:hypothetical protein
VNCPDADNSPLRRRARVGHDPGQMFKASIISVIVLPLTVKAEFQDACAKGLVKNIEN